MKKHNLTNLTESNVNCYNLYISIILVFMLSSICYSDDYYELEKNWNQAFGVPQELSININQAGESTHNTYWGVATTIGKDWPSPDGKSNKKYIDWLCRLGFNFQRINGLDYKRAHLFKTWQESPNRVSQGLMPIVALIKELKQNSILYSLSINNMSYKYDSMDVLKNVHPVKHKEYKYSQIIDPIAVQTASDWHRTIYDQVLTNGETIAKDEYNVFITALGEDSLLAGYFFNKGQFLGPELELILDQLFTLYLNKKYLTTQEFYSSWQIEGYFGKKKIGTLGKGINLPSAIELEDLSSAAKQDVIGFLIAADMAYAKKMHAALDSIGYGGLYTFTNDWYGPAVLNTNALVGSFIDVHSYFDHRLKGGEDNPGAEVIQSKSFIQNIKVHSDGFIKPYERNLYHMFASSVKNYPLFVTEWNHAAWSEYAYEGPLLTAAYASLQGYNGLMLHTLKVWNMNIDQEFSTDSFAILGNPVMLALNPTLSYVYRNQIISKAKKSVDIVLSESNEDLLELGAEVGLNMRSFYKHAALNNGFIHKVNIVPVGKSKIPSPLNELLGNFVSDTGEIKLYLDDDNPRLEINTPNFKAVAGTTPTEGINLNDQWIKIEGHGAVTILSLDNQPIETSKDILVTAVRDFKNSNMKLKTVKNFRHIDAGILIEDSGSEPVLMGRVHGSIKLKFNHESAMRIEAVSFSGKIQNVSSHNENNDQSLILELDQCDTPWYRIRSKIKVPSTTVLSYQKRHF